MTFYFSAMPGFISKKPRLPLLFATLGFLGGAITSCDNSSPRAAIRSEIDKGVSALRREDIDAYLDQIAEENLPPDSSATVIALAKIRASILVQWGATQTRRISVTLDSVDVLGDSAYVFSTLHWDRILDGMGGRKDTVITDLKHKEIWRNTRKGWRSVRVLSTEGTSSVNGRVETVNQGP
jgi:ketosteroid isomerase-like protein